MAIDFSPLIQPFEPFAAGGTSWLSAPIEVISGSIALAQAHSIGDVEGKIDASLRLATAPFSLLEGCTSALNTLIHLGTLIKLKLDIPFLSTPLSGVGIGLCGLELIPQVISMVRAVNFLQTLESFETPASYLNHLSSSYLIITDEEKKHLERLVGNSEDLSPQQRKEKLATMTEDFLKVKKMNLSRRIGAWCARELEIEVPCALELLKSSDPSLRFQGQKKAEEIIDMVHTQARKTLLISTLRILAILFSLVGLILTLLPVIPLIPMVLLAVGTGLGIVKYLMATGLFETKGWNFSPLKCVPECIRSCFVRFDAVARRYLQV